MAYTSGSYQSTISLGHRLREMFRDLSVSYGKWRTYRKTVRALGDLSDRELHDLGLTRVEITRTALQAVYGAAPMTGA